MTKTHIIDCFTMFETNQNIKNLLERDGKVTKIVYNMMDREPITELISINDVSKIIYRIRNDPSKNYHDYLTTIKIIDDHIMYDLIVEVNYRYVYA